MASVIHCLIGFFSRTCGLTLQQFFLISGYHFRNLTELRVLSVLRMNITNIDKTIFEHIPGVKGLDLSQNPVFKISGSSFSELPDLQEFTCNSCQLSGIDGQLFSGLTKLRMVSLHDNEIGEILPGTFDTNLALESLSLSR